MIETAVVKTATAPKTNLLGLDLPSLKDFFASLEEKPFRAMQVFKWIHQHGAECFDDMTDLSKSLRERLKDLAEIRGPQQAIEQSSSDGTQKWLLRLEDGQQIETVFIPEKDRGTLCISSQVGCALNCRFCSTATQGFNRNLSAHEIIGQLWFASKKLPKRITNIVMMGMGEPLLNYDAVVKALSIMREDNAYNLSWKRVTVSTSGVVPQIERLSKDLDVSLAVSLHAPSNELRNELVPINKKYPIEILMDACKNYVGNDKRRHITMEYVMLKGVNDTALHARQLIKTLSKVPCKINLIPFNPFPNARFVCSTEADIQTFRMILIKAGFVTTVRKTRGQDIDAACGQLKGQILDRTKRSTSERLRKLHFKEESSWIPQEFQEKRAVG